MRAKFVIPFSELRFSYARSGGAGGQNVNKVNSKVIMDWDLTASPSLPEDVKERFRARYKNLIKENGEVQIQSDRERSQKMNVDDCIKKLHEMIEKVAVPPRPRKKTKPTKSSVRKRLDSKKLHSAKKESRRKNY
ncbi:MAG: alternative ribosome rescue aminoacyl-tRNA hydrolase ArfB [Bacteriovoracaceae bacterium]